MAEPKGLASAFKKFDINGDGTISEEELKLVMMLLDPSLSRPELDLIFTEADLSKASRGLKAQREMSGWLREFGGPLKVAFSKLKVSYHRKGCDEAVVFGWNSV